MADAFWRLSLNVGLPIRRVQLTANGRNAYDTHMTTEVWLPGWRIWAIDDAFFGGWWSDTRSAHPTRPVPATVRPRGGPLRQPRGFAGTTPGRRSSLRSTCTWTQSALFWIAYYPMYVDGHDWPSFVVTRPADVAVEGTYVTTSDLLAASPSRTLPVTAVQLATPSQAVRATPTSPPPYARKLLSRRRVTLAGASGSWSYAGGRSTFVVVRGAGGRWLLTVHGSPSPLDEIAGVHLSAISSESGQATVAVRWATPGLTRGLVGEDDARERRRRSALTATPRRTASTTSVPAGALRAGCSRDIAVVALAGLVLLTGLVLISRASRFTIRSLRGRAAPRAC